MQDHEKFHLVANEAPLLFSRELQMGEEKKPKHMTLAEAVKTGIIANQTLAYFIGRTYMFLKRVGLTPEVGAADAWRCQRIHCELWIMDSNVSAARELSPPQPPPCSLSCAELIGSNSSLCCTSGS